MTPLPREFIDWYFLSTNPCLQIWTWTGKQSISFMTSHLLAPTKYGQFPQWLSQPTLGLLQHGALQVGSANSSTRSPGPHRDDHPSDGCDMPTSGEQGEDFPCLSVFPHLSGSSCSPTQNLKQWGEQVICPLARAGWTWRSARSAAAGPWPPSLKRKEPVLLAAHLPGASSLNSSRLQNRCSGHKPLSSPAPHSCTPQARDSSSCCC